MQVLEITPAHAPMAKYPGSGKRLISSDFSGDAISEERSWSSASDCDGLGKGKLGPDFVSNVLSIKCA